MWKDLRKEVKDVIWGCISVILVTLIMNLLAYIGAHIPDIIDLGSKFVSAVVGIKVARK